MIHTYASSSLSKGTAWRFRRARCRRKIFLSSSSSAMRSSHDTALERLAESLLSGSCEYALLCHETINAKKGRLINGHGNSLHIGISSINNRLASYSYPTGYHAVFNWIRLPVKSSIFLPRRSRGLGNFLPVNQCVLFTRHKAFSLLSQGTPIASSHVGTALKRHSGRR